MFSGAVFTVVEVGEDGTVGREPVLIAIGNSRNERFVPSVIRLLGDEEPLVRGAAVWALARLDTEAFEDQKALRKEAEQDAEVLAEWSIALDDDHLLE